MIDLGQQLADTIDQLDIPEADLVDRVLAELSTPTSLEAARGARHRRNLAVAGAAAAVLIAVATVAIEPARSAVADVLGFGATRIERETVDDRPTTGTAPSLASVPPSTTNTSDPPELEEGRINPLPSLGVPEVVDGRTSRRRTYSWDAEGGVTLEVRTTAGELDMKRLAPEPGVEFLSLDIDGQEITALWIPFVHERTLEEPEVGDPGGTGPVTVGPTLLWVRGDLQFRLEADSSKDAVVALAIQVEGGTDLLAAG